MDYNKGNRVGDYEIVDVLGAGGMGRVYKVRNLISERLEAMKVLLPNLESDPDLADRFMREIKVQASLQHPHIAALHTALRVDNQLVMLIEYLEGVTVESALRQGRLPVDKAVEQICQVLSALTYAHSRGVVHRDIKPANMMLLPDGSVKLMDFGIARLEADRRLTQTGRTVGSLYYMSPEQIQGAPDLDARSDLYSLGVSLYEMVTAQRPFQGDSDYSIMAAHLSAHPVPPIEIDPALPAALNLVILKAIAREPVDRYQTAEEFRAALREPARDLRTAPRAVKVEPAAPMPVALPPHKPKSSRGLYMAVGSVVTVAVLALAAVQAPRFFGSSANTVPEKKPEAKLEQTVDAPAPRPLADARGSETGSEPRPSGSVLRESAQVQRRETGAAPSPPYQTAVPVPKPQEPPAPVSQVPVPQPPDTAQQEALRAQREVLMLLATRANASRAGLNTMRQQQASLGVNLRADISAAEQRMEAYLDDAEQAQKSGDAARMKKSLDAAERALETVEKFLGR